MNKNPYSVLGVNENATDEEIKKVYRELVKKYHPDKYTDTDLADLANEKMQEVNAAYDEIQKMRKEGTSSGANFGGAYSSGNYSSGSSSSSSGGSGYAQIRQYINMRNFASASSLLNAIPVSARGAEWNFLMGCTLMGVGRVFDARAHLERACSMDPSNLEYRAARDRAANITFSGNNMGNMQTARGCGGSGCDMCTSLLCADCLCECCGGDLISCC